MSGGTLYTSAECPGGHSARGDNPPSHTGTVIFCAVIQFHTFNSTALCCLIDRMKKDGMISNIPLECTFFTLFRTMRIEDINLKKKSKYLVKA